MIAERDAIDAGAQQFAIDGRRNARAAGGVLAIGDNQIELFARDQSWQGLHDDVPARFAYHVSDQQDTHRQTVLRPLDANLAGHFGKSGFAQHGHFDFARIGQLFLERFGDVVADLGGRGVGGVLGAGQDAQFASGLDGKGVVDAGEAAGDGFEFFHALDIAFECFAAGAGREALQASAAATSTV